MIRDNVMKEFKMTLLRKVKSSDFESGYFSVADEYLEMVIENIGPICFRWIYELYQEKYEDEQFIEKLIGILCHVPADKITTECIKIVSDSINRKSHGIKEMAVRAFENWEYTDAIPILENTHFDNYFLENYLQVVIQDLKEVRKQDR